MQSRNNIEELLIHSLCFLNYLYLTTFTLILIITLKIFTDSNSPMVWEPFSTTQVEKRAFQNDV